MAYVKQTEAAYEEQTRQRQEKQLHRRAKELGYELKKVETPATPEVAEPPDYGLRRRLGLNCPEFPESCRFLEFGLLVDVADVFADRANVLLE